MDPSLMLPFHLPTSTDMLISFGAGIGGMNQERAKRYWPSVPPEFLEKLDFPNKNGDGGGGYQWRMMSRGWGRCRMLCMGMCC